MPQQSIAIQEKMRLFEQNKFNNEQTSHDLIKLNPLNDNHIIRGLAIEENRVKKKS